jgi:hypothetical protein
MRLHTLLIALLTTLILTLNGCGGGGSGSGETDSTAPSFTSNNSITMKENHVFVTTVHADDDSTVTYSIISGKMMVLNLLSIAVQVTYDSWQDQTLKTL